MKIKFFPFVQTMIEQEEVLIFTEGKLLFRRMYGPDIVEQEFDLSDNMADLLKKLDVDNTELKEFEDVIIVEDDEQYVFNKCNSSLSFKELSLLLEHSLDFKYNPRALIKTREPLFYIGDVYKMYEHHYYQEAKDLILDNNLVLNGSTVMIDGEEVSIEMNKYKVISFNTTNKLYQVVISLLMHKELI